MVEVWPKALRTGNNASWITVMPSILYREKTIDESGLGCARSSDVSGLYLVLVCVLRTKKVHEFDPYGPEANSATLNLSFP